MKTYALVFLVVMVSSTSKAGDMDNYKKYVALWYEAFDRHDPATLDRILSENWKESPSEPGTKPAGREDVKGMLVKLTTTFPAFNIIITDIIHTPTKLVALSTTPRP